MQHVSRLSLALLLATSLCGAAWSRTVVKEAEYKRSGTNFYWRGDVVKVDPSAVIVPANDYKMKGDSYFISPTKKPAKEIYVQVIKDWIEPITPPDMPKSLGVAPDAMQIREPQGDVQVALPSAPSNFSPATDNMTIPNGAIIKTGDNGTAAVLFGGVDSARLIPNSQAAVQQTVAATSRATEVDLTRGAVFSKVGHRVGVKEDYKVKTPFGVAAARGTDFVTVALPARTDVWIAQGTVDLNAPDGKLVGEVKSEGTGALKIIRFPSMADMHQAMMASSETMTAAMNFIPTVNLKLKALHDKLSQGLKLTPSEQDYLARIKKVPCLIKLALVEPPAPAPAPAITPRVSPPAIEAVPAPGASTAPAMATPAVVKAPAPLKPLNIDLRPTGKIRFKGEMLTLDELKPKLDELARTTPEQPYVIRAGKKVKYEQLKAVTDYCANDKLQVTVKATIAPPPPAETAATKPASAPSAATPSSSEPMQPSMASTSSNAPPVSPAPPIVASKPTKPKHKPSTPAVEMDNSPASTIP